MNIVHLRLSLRGTLFSPSAFASKTGATLVGAREPGEIAVRGRFAGQKTPFGAADVPVATSAATTGDLLAFSDEDAEKLQLHIQIARTLGAEDVVLHADLAHEGQCNLEFSPGLLQRLDRFGVPLTVSCFPHDDIQV